MRSLALATLALVLVGCGSSESVHTSNVDDVDAADDVAQLVDAPSDAPHDAADDVAHDAAADAPHALCCQVGQNIEVCAPGDPFHCDYVATHEGICTDPQCAAGDGCSFLFGSGVVVPCGL